jgi:hypothetical protein
LLFPHLRLSHSLSRSTSTKTAVMQEILNSWRCFSSGEYPSRAHHRFCRFPDIPAAFQVAALRLGAALRRPCDRARYIVLFRNSPAFVR